MSWLPTYYETTFHLDLNEVGIYSLIPMPFFVAVVLSTGFVTDYLLRNKIIPLYILRRLLQCLALCFTATGLLVLALVKDLSLVATVVIVVFSFSSLGLTSGGKDANFIDLSPKYASSMFAFANVIGTLPGILGVYVTGLLLEETNDDWSAIFLLTAGLCLFAAVIWFIFARTDPVDFDEEEYLLLDKKGRDFKIIKTEK